MNLKFNQTMTMHTVDVPITNDTFLEYDERLHVTVTLDTVGHGVTLTPDIANITIMDDDGKCLTVSRN